MVEGPGGHALEENIEQQNRTVNWPFNWLFRKSGANTRKTVTFGDAAEVSGALQWTILRPHPDNGAVVRRHQGVGPAAGVERARRGGAGRASRRGEL